MRHSWAQFKILWENPFAALTIFVLLSPILMGLSANFLSAFGYGIGTKDNALSLVPITTFLSWPGITQAAFLSIWSGVCAAMLSVAITVVILISWSKPWRFVYIKQLLAPLLAVPHAAAAFGFAFLVAPSGWLARLFSPWLTGWERPLDWLIIHDPLAISLIFGMVIKEVPFLLLISLSALRQIDQEQRVQLGQTMGYSRTISWLIGVFPALYLRLRLPVLVVLTWSMSVVDVALILGPTTPPTLAVQILRWMSDANLVFRQVASIGALAQLGLCIFTVVIWGVGERIVYYFGTILTESGHRGREGRLVHLLAVTSVTMLIFTLFAGVLAHLVWSFAGYWQFPDPLPDGLSLHSWSRHADGMQSAWGQTVLIAGFALAIGLVLTIGSLENELRSRREAKALSWIIYVPLIVPQVAFLPGVQTGMLLMGWNGGIEVVVFAHLIYVIPYLRLILAGHWQHWDYRYDVVSQTMGKRKSRVFWQIRLPILLAAVLSACAVATSVSVGQYLPTLLIGGGRIETLTTEAVALFSGGDRRAIGVFSTVQTLAVLLPFIAAIIVPRWLWRNRKGLNDG